MLKKLFVAAVVAAAATAPVQAEEQLNPWVDCGIGAMIFKDVAAGAVISNVIWDLGTTAVSSNASSPETCESSRAKGAAMIQQGIDVLETETAQGQGEYVAAVLNTMGCESADHTAVVEAVRADFAKDASVAGYQDKSQTERAQAYYQNVESKVAAQCKAS